MGDNADQLWWVALDFKDECRPIYHMRFMKEDDARKHGFEPRGQDAESGMMWDAIDNHYVCLKFSPDDSLRNRSPAWASPARGRAMTYTT